MEIVKWKSRRGGSWEYFPKKNSKPADKLSNTFFEKDFSNYVTLLDSEPPGGSMFYLLLALLHEDFASGRIDFATYFENTVLLAQDHERIKSNLEQSKAA
ncbi:Hypothetical protein LBF_0235 [Leptospira biflexa serovar Patoc strain 'Patoc 1 (Ames)']|uniref:Uncharacterized protein n=1 Tax=Leptospira biflexa serovar Patoc (strain Patoc 1 / ATCC 23582 / Paris) TaxID=456481 RepID=B0SKH2_LEPBP|nr:hypothetical protein [Leptospira biflexa]ABZ92780.1 Hypothetical protein LBF_0235 [Leptospira biflexa serovar Patoc strain 'Patoc 1 (Ames)']ABZ96386.1 Hypothetical protein LEPBI_I0241 [Leptospira biflexa serovar Patoc strain 'Patoc 1 (Paris)']